MISTKRLTIYLWIILCASPQLATAKGFTINGTVTDAVTGQGIELASVYLAGLDIGTYTDEHGRFEISTDSLSDTLIISELSHIPLKMALKNADGKDMHIILQQNKSQLQEVVVVSDKDPGAKLMKKVIAHKSVNNPDQKRYTYRSYDRRELDINNFNADSNKSEKLPQLMLDAINRMDTANIRTKQLPVYFTETISEQRHHPASVIDDKKITAQKTLGIQTDNVFQKLDRYSISVHIYDNWIPLFNKTFVSPVSDRGTDFYKYYIADTLIEEGHKIYNIQFVPKQHENAFRGNLKIMDSTYAVVAVDMRLSRDANLNFVQALNIRQEFAYFNNASIKYLPSKTESTVTFQSGPDLIGIPISGKSDMINLSLTDKKVLTNLAFDVDSQQYIDVSAFKEKSIGNYKKDETFWAANRPDSLTIHERAIYGMIDTLKENRRFQQTTKIAAFAGTGFWDFGNKWRIGPYSSFISLDKIEGVRFRAGFWSLPGLDEHWNINGYLAYGTKDQKFKGGLGVKYLHSLDPWSKTSVYARSDYDVIIDYDDELDRDNIISSILRKNIPSYRSYIKELKLSHEEEFAKSWTNQTSVTYKEYNPVFAFQYPNIDTDDANYPSFMHALPVAEVSTSFRFSPGQRYMVLNYDRITLYTTHPVFTVSYTYGMEVLSSEFEYHKIKASISQNLKLPPKTTLYYHIAAGRTFGTVPYLLLDVPRGNEFYVSSKYSFNTMAPYEFIADKYVSLQARLSLGGLILDHIPYLQKLQWRERISFNSFLGGLSAENQQFNANSNTYQTGRVPFAETGVGIENIFHSISIEYYWRLTHLDNKFAARHGIYAGVTLSF